MVSRIDVALYILITIVTCSITYAEDPWGIDSDLVTYRQLEVIEPKPFHNALVNFTINAVAFHKAVISKADGPRSNFIPSSSIYTRDCIKKYGFFQGYLMGCDRLMRENADPWEYPIVYIDGRKIKWNPVP